MVSSSSPRKQPHRVEIGIFVLQQLLELADGARVSFRSTAICAIIARGLRGPVAIGTISAARSSTLNASSMRPAFRRYSPSATCAWKLSGNAAAIDSGFPFPGSSSFGGLQRLDDRSVFRVEQLVEIGLQRVDVDAEPSLERRFAFEPVAVGHEQLAKRAHAVFPTMCSVRIEAS